MRMVAGNRCEEVRHVILVGDGHLLYILIYFEQEADATECISRERLPNLLGKAIAWIIMPAALEYKSSLHPQSATECTVTSSHVWPVLRTVIVALFWQH